MILNVLWNDWMGLEDGSKQRNGFLIVMGILTISGWGFDGDGVRFGILTTSGGGGNLTVEGIMVERDNGRGNGGWR